MTFHFLRGSLFIPLAEPGEELNRLPPQRASNTRWVSNTLPSQRRGQQSCRFKPPSRQSAYVCVFQHRGSSKKQTYIITQLSHSTSFYLFWCYFQGFWGLTPGSALRLSPGGLCASNVVPLNSGLNSGWIQIEFRSATCKASTLPYPLSCHSHFVLMRWQPT